MDVVGGSRGQEDDGAREILGLAPATGRDSCRDGVVARRGRREAPGVVRAHVAGGDRVDVHARAAPIRWPGPWSAARRRPWRRRRPERECRPGRPASTRC